MPVQKVLASDQGSKLPVKIWTNEVEPEAEQQLRNTARLPFIFKHVAAMPDVHLGIGATVGSVIATKGAIIPAAVGVDIGCGMAAVKLPFSIDCITNPAELRHSIERAVPVGRFGHKELNARRAEAWLALGECSAHTQKGPPGEATNLIKNATLQLGSLGGGNHFIEVCQDEQGGAWIMLHSGSRNIGKVLAERHIDKARDLMKRYFIDLPDPDLAYFVQKTDEFKSYIRDLNWAQQYALANRHEMLLLVLREVWMHVHGPESVGDESGPILSTLFQVNCHHNYTAMESHFGHNVWVTRKGAVRAREGDFGIIPGSMGTRSYIVKGKGNVDSFCSCSHGAGRRMSRTKARQMFDVAEFERQTSGVECRKDVDVIDEIPGAYKDIDAVMENQSDLVEVACTLKQILCVKG